MVSAATLGLLVKGGLAIGKNIQGMVGAKKARNMGAELVDPNQQAIANATKRMLRANQTGTSSYMDRRMNASDNKMMFRRSAMAGNRSFAPYLQIIRGADANIRANASQERLGLLGQLSSQTNDIADRKMDLLEQDKQQAILDNEARKQTSGKNLAALLPTAQDSVTESQNQRTLKDGRGLNRKKKNGNFGGLDFLGDALTVGTTAAPQ